MYELSLRKVHGFWANLRYIFFPWIKADSITSEIINEPPTEKEHDLNEFYQFGPPMSRIMTMLAIVGILTAAFFAYKYGAF